MLNLYDKINLTNTLIYFHSLLVYHVLKTSLEIKSIVLLKKIITKINNISKRIYFCYLLAVTKKIESKIFNKQKGAERIKVFG